MSALAPISTKPATLHNGRSGPLATFRVAEKSDLLAALPKP
jgi:hypothetical protein